jgi:hypothetical protein
MAWKYCSNQVGEQRQDFFDDQEGEARNRPMRRQAFGGPTAVPK